MSTARGRSGYDERGDGEAPYRGKVGATRTEPLHVPLGDGRTRSINVHVGINVGSDPHLREAAMTGALHRFEGGEELAVAYVFHDPVQRRLCVVVPEVLRHTALRERAKLLGEIAADREVPVPPYACDAGVVVGALGLKAYLEAPDATTTSAAQTQAEDLLGAQRTALEMERGEIERLRAQVEKERASAERDRAAAERDRLAGGAHSSANAARETELVAERQALVLERQDLATMRSELERDRRDFETSRGQLEQRETRVRERAESVTSREDELRSQAEEHEATTRDLAMREQELAARLEALGEREQALAQRAEVVGAGEAARRPQSGGSMPPPSRASARPIVEPIDAADDVEELEELDPVSTEAGRTHGGLGDAVEEIVDDDDVEEEVDADTLGVREETTGVHGEVEGPKTTIATSAAIAVAAAALSGPRLPDALRDHEMAARLDDGVVLDVRLPEGVDGLGELDLLAQLSDSGGAPIVLLSLTMGALGHRIVRRAALDPRIESDRSVLEQLRRRYEARCVFYTHDGNRFDEGQVVAQREANVTRILDRVHKLRGAGAAPDIAKTRALAAPPPVAEPNPFSIDDDGKLGSAAQVARALVELADWLGPERLDHALTVLSVPHDAVDRTITRSLERALSLGLAMAPSLVERAITSGLAPDVPSLVARLIDSFQRTVTRPDRGALDEQAIATNWERLLAAAAEGEIALDPDTHEIAVRAIRAVRGETTGAGPSGDVDPARLAEMAPPELVVMLDHPKYRRAAAVALAERGDAAYADVLCKAVRKMPRAEVVRVAPRLIRLGEEAGDALIDGLSARKTFVRQAFALVLSHLKLRRAVVPLLHRLTAEEAPIHRELARVVGTFGNAAFRPLVRQLSDAKAPEDRVVRALSHLALQGCEKQVQELTRDSDARTASLAVRALAGRDEARAQDEIVLGKRPADDVDAVLAFSRRFEEELRGTAPEADLATIEDER